MIKIKGYGVSTSEDYALEHIKNSLEMAIIEGVGIVSDKEQLLKSFEVSKKKTEEESGKTLDGLYVIEVEIKFTPKITVKKVEYAEDTSDDN